MNARMQALYDYMNQEKLDALIVTLPKHVYYLTGYLSDPHERLLAAVLTPGDEPFLIAPALDREAAEAASQIKRIVTHSDTDNAYEVLKRHLPSGIRRLGVEKDHLTVASFEALSGVIGADAYADAGRALLALRAVKSADEAARMRDAARLVEDVLRAGLAHVREGVTEIELAAELDYQMKKLGAQGPSFETTVLAGERSAMPHGASGTRRIRAGELLLFDLGVYLNGYASDITRTFAVGDIDAQLRDVYDAVLQGNLAGIAASRPGVTFASIDKAARDVISARGYGEYFTHRLGHGLGLDVHEYPSMHGANRDLAKAGMAFTIEPGVYLPGRGGVRIEDDVIVTENGVDVLTTFPKELTIIG